jgi:hypothetical protein
MYRLLIHYELNKKLLLLGPTMLRHKYIFNITTGPTIRTNYFQFITINSLYISPADLLPIIRRHCMYSNWYI